MNPEQSDLLRLRQKLDAIEYEIAANRERLTAITTRQGWLATQRSDCLKIIAKLTLAKVEV